MDYAGVTDTGERVDVEAGARLSHEQETHLAHYTWAAELVSGHILDVACGTGYGTVILAQQGSAVGLDVDDGALAIARDRAPGIEFERAELPPIPYPDETFDAVATFETVEHIEDDTGFLAEILRVLKPGGQVLLSTPNKDITSPDGPPTNHWHVREYRLEDLLRLLEPFEDVQVWAQRLPPRTFVERMALKLVARFPVLCRPGRWWDRLAHGDGRVQRWDGVNVPVIWVLSARKP